MKKTLLWLLLAASTLTGGYHFGQWNKPPEVYVIVLPIPCKSPGVSI